MAVHASNKVVLRATARSVESEIFSRGASSKKLAMGPWAQESMDVRELASRTKRITALSVAVKVGYLLVIVPGNGGSH